MKAFYDNKPAVIEAVGNGSYRYRFDIEEVEFVAQKVNTEAEEAQSESPSELRTQFKCEEVTVWAPLTSNRITEAVITEICPPTREQKLVNEYNAAQLGLYGSKTSEEAKKRVASYTEYLTTRAALKAQVDKDCAELGIV